MKGRLVVLLALLALAGGCSVNEVIVAEQTELIVAETPPEESRLLDIGVIEFEQGLKQDNDPDDSGIYEDIRAAESRYLPYHLKTTLQGTGHWGAVRVVPSVQAVTDILINGRIERSNGEYVDLEVTVSDASGRTWYTRTYDTQTGISSYSENRDRREDPYQKVFNDIANDLNAYVRALPPGQVERLRQVSELRFFADMSPAQFSGYLAPDEDGYLAVQRLPANDDPSVERLRRIRERDRLVVDTLNEHYANFYYGIAIPYESWRKTARQEAINYREVRRAATMQTLIGVAALAASISVDTDDRSRSQRRMKGQLQNIAIGESLGAIFRGITRGSEAKIHRESIKELSESFGAEAAPMVVDVEGQTRRLSGTAFAQYESWRKLLREIYEAETGFSATTDADAAPERVPEPAG